MPFNGKRMKQLRIKRGIRIGEMGKLLGLQSYQIVARYEKGEVEPKGHRLEQIADALKTNVGYLLGRTNYPEKLTRTHYDVLEAFDRGDSGAIIDLLRKHLVKQGVGKKVVPGHKPRSTK